MNKIKSIFTSFLNFASHSKKVLSIKQALLSIVLAVAFVNPCLAKDTDEAMEGGSGEKMEKALTSPKNYTKCGILDKCDK